MACSPTPVQGLSPIPSSSEAPPGKALNPELFVPPPLKVGPQPVVLWSARALLLTEESNAVKSAFVGSDQPVGQWLDQEIR
jgi:hypothetical protein